MMVSTKGRYALRVMIDLAEHQAEGYIQATGARLPSVSRRMLPTVYCSGGLVSR